MAKAVVSNILLHDGCSCHLWECLADGNCKSALRVVGGTSTEKFASTSTSTGTSTRTNTSTVLVLVLVLVPVLALILVQY